MNKELGECEKEIEYKELMIRGIHYRGHIVKRVGVSVSHKLDIDWKIRGATTEEEAMRVAKEFWEKNNGKKLTAQFPGEMQRLQSGAGLKEETPSDEEDSLESYFNVNDTSSAGHEGDSESSEPKPSFNKSPENEI